jgi:cyclopropane fatty-acyl-phospholipid synthase-like methyltransferase
MVSSSSSQGKQEFTAQPLLDMNYAFARTAMLLAAVRLHLFTLLAEKALTPVELATRAGALPDPTARLLKGLEALGLVEREGDTYRLTALANVFLVEGKPSYLGGDTLAMQDYVPAWFDLDRTLQTATPYRDLGDATTAEAFFAPRVVDLFPLVFPIASRVAADLSLAKEKEAPLQVLDVGAGSAPWSAAFAHVYPEAQITALDLPRVIEQGRQHIEKRGLSDRYTWIAADMETYAFPAHTYDLILCSHICRFISDERVQSLLARLVTSLYAGGTIIIADVFFTEDRKGPPPAITLDLSMLVNSAQGRIRTVSEIAGWLEECGLIDIQRVHLTGPFPVVVARKKKEK